MKSFRLLYPGFFFYFLFLIVGSFLLIIFPKGELLISINGRNSDLADFLFKYGTYLGDGLVFAFLIIIFLLFNYYKTLIIIISVIIQTILIQGLKLFVYPDLVRPKKYLENFNDLHLVPGVEIHTMHTFPSGHTATAFTIGVLLSLFVKNRSWSMLFMFIAILVGISRVYLLQHFFVDIYVGSIIGFLTAYVTYMLMERTSLKAKASWQRGLLM